MIAGVIRWGLGATVLATATIAPAQLRRPNIVVILMDDWGFTDVGSFGGEIATPHIDALARAGVRFSNFHVAGSCSPTRAMLQTGVSSHRAGLGNMPETIPPAHVGKPGYDTELNDRVVTIAQRLRAAGYRTYFSGKWHLGRAPGKLPGARGYDRALALGDSGADNFADQPIHGMYERADWTEDGRPANLPARFYSSTLIVDRAIGYIDSGRSSGRPFFASLNFLANHIPVQAPDADIARYAGRYRNGWDALRQARAARAAALGIVPATTRLPRVPTTRPWAALSSDEKAGQARAMAAYAAMATATDRAIGRLVAHLKSTGDYADTIFVFTSDNGPEPTEPRARWTNRMALSLYYDADPAQAGRPGTMTAIGRNWASAAAAPLYGYKFSAGEGGLRVPLIVAWPGNPAVRAGSIAPKFAHVVDIAPTLLALAAVRADTFPGTEAMIGADLTPVLTGARDAARAPDATIGYELSGNAALFRGDLKLVRNLPPLGDGGWKLHDVLRDPGETRDLSQAQPAAFTAMRAAYDDYARADRVLPMPDGYTAEAQIVANARRNNLLPRLRAAALWALLILLVVGLIVWRRRSVSR